MPRSRSPRIEESRRRKKERRERSSPRNARSKSPSSRLPSSSPPRRRHYSPRTRRTIIVRSQREADTRLGSIEIFVDGDISEALSPAFSPHHSRYYVATPLSSDTVGVLIRATAHSPHSSVRVHRWEASADAAARPFVELINGVVRRRVDWRTVQATLVVQKTWRGQKVRSELLRHRVMAMPSGQGAQLFFQSVQRLCSARSGTTVGVDLSP